MMPVDPDQELTITLTAAQWSALTPKIMDTAFHAALALNQQLLQQQAKLGQEARTQGLKARLREVND